MEDGRQIPRKPGLRPIDTASPLCDVDGKARPHSKFTTASDFQADFMFDQQNEGALAEMGKDCATDRNFDDWRLDDQSRSGVPINEKLRNSADKAGKRDPQTHGVANPLASDASAIVNRTRQAPVISRRRFLQSVSLAATAVAAPSLWIPRAAAVNSIPPLATFGYGDVTLASDLHEKQLAEMQALLMELSEDSLLKPFRQMSGQPAPGEDLGGWYHYDPGERLADDWVGFVPGAPFGQWVSALARMYAISGSQRTREKVLRLNRLYSQTISGDYYAKNRFPTYCYDKLVCGLIDSYRYAADPDAFAILDRTTDAALPHFPSHAVEHGTAWRTDKKGEEWTWDESYTISENLFLAYQLGAGKRYRDLATQYLHDSFYDRLARGENDMAGRHAYSHVNSLSSAMQAYLTLGTEKYLRASRNAFTMLVQQSFATGGWGPDEILLASDSDDLFRSLSNTHSSFETPCGAYAHFKLTRYLLTVSRESQYGDSLERVMYNTVLGAKPLRADGSAFYYSDYNFKGRKVYSQNRWPCCSGTLPQVAADYRINTYYRDAEGIYVNLYLPSTVRWTQGDAYVALTQKGNYPFDGGLEFELTATKATEFTVNLRIPSWAEGASVAVNGRRLGETIAAEQFASIRRQWRTGDRIELELPMRLRLEPIDERHPGTVALLWGPLVLFAIATSSPPVTSRELLSAKKTGSQTWRVTTENDSGFEVLPFTAIGDQPYTTYLVLA